MLVQTCWAREMNLPPALGGEQICGRRRRRDERGEERHPFLEKWFWSSQGRGHSLLTEIMHFWVLSFLWEHHAPLCRGPDALPQFPHQCLGIWLLPCDCPKTPNGKEWAPSEAIQRWGGRKIPLEMVQSCHPIPPLAFLSPEWEQSLSWC